MDIRKVKKLIEMLEESSVSEIEIHEGDDSVRVSRHKISAVPTQAIVQVADNSTDNPVAKSDAVQTEDKPVITETREDRELEGHIVKAPIVGLFYEAPSPGKAPFVELGQSVLKGDVLCVIEAMKIMNQIETDYSGVISKIMVENGEPVEYGQPLFLIREA